METTVKQRLIKFIEFKKLSRKKFEEMIGVSNGYINNLKAQPREAVIQKIILSFPDLNKVWLLTGEGEMLNGSNVVEVPVTQNKTQYTTTASGGQFVKLEDGTLQIIAPLVPINALASMGDDCAAQLNYDREEWEKIPFNVSEVHQGKYIAFKVDGDSMDDGTRMSFERGDLLLCRELPRDEWMPRLHINRWRFWVVCWGNNVRLKEIIAQDTTTGHITLHSLNPSPEYTNFTLQLDDIHKLYNVIKKKPKDTDY